jgi:hypothetical protein
MVPISLSYTTPNSVRRHRALGRCLTQYGYMIGQTLRGPLGARPLTGRTPLSLPPSSGRRGLRVAEQGYLAPLEHGAGSSCRSLYALALMFPLSSHMMER